MKHLLGVILRRACLVIAAIMVLLWIRSLDYTDDVEFGLGGQGWSGEIVSYQGKLFLRAYPEYDDHGERFLGWEHYAGPPDGATAESVYHVAPEDETHFGFAAYVNEWSVDNDPVEKQPTLVTPFWFWMLLFGAWPVCKFVRGRAGSRSKWQGHCATCGYDLRASPVRCPECGTPADGLQPAAAPR